ncbi:MAG: alcohol dehydrogenase catalytic domain-containing protein [Deltaproteobacteria bacterium]|nr:alcohol dehydrogenase catalytic domain-containing protein [Deltaproteobacteria bacterium]MBW1813143.1 alcohol dehydrogenase catalytic domain-containing protein [Deltaproteobacteria bacterium]MBW1846327.1 alcohol dehydrogenase catalytic domain-containing protein [Deltaproteobacteria bacterium]
MQTAVFRKSTGLVIEDIPIPELDRNQVLVKIADTGFCGSDHTFIETEGTPDGIILGHEVSGTVTDMGPDVTNVSNGMRVIIRPTFCGECHGCSMGKPQLCSNNRRSIGIGDLSGGFAEYIKVFPQMLIPIPDNVDSQNAALAEVCAVSLHAIKSSGKKSGSVLVIGGGTVGLSLVSLLKLYDFHPIVVSEPVLEKRVHALEFGADIAINPLTENLNQRAFEINNGTGFETVFECVGLQGLISTAMDVAAQGGTICQLSVMFENIEINPATMMFKELHLTASYGNTHEENKECLKWMAEGKLDAKPLISDLITLDQLPDIYRERIHTGKARKVLLQIGEEF